MLANYRAPVAFNKNKYNKTRENEKLPKCINLHQISLVFDEFQGWMKLKAIALICINYYLMLNPTFLVPNASSIKIKNYMPWCDFHFSL